MRRRALCIYQRVLALCAFFFNRGNTEVTNSVFVALSTVFHSINFPDDSPLSHSVLPVLILPYWSFQLYTSFKKVSLSPDIYIPLWLTGLKAPTNQLTNLFTKVSLSLIVLCGWLGLKHQLTNLCCVCVDGNFVLLPMTGCSSWSCCFCRRWRRCCYWWLCAIAGDLLLAISFFCWQLASVVTFVLLLMTCCWWLCFCW